MAERESEWGGNAIYIHLFRSAARQESPDLLSARNCCLEEISTKKKMLSPYGCDCEYAGLWGFARTEPNLSLLQKKQQFRDKRQEEA